MKKLIALLLAVVMILTLCACGKKSKDKEDGGSSYSDAVKTMFAVRFEGKVNKMKDLAPKEYWDWMEEENGRSLEDICEDYEEMWEDQKDYYEEDYGEDYRVTHKIEDKTKLDEDTVAGIAAALEDTYGINANKVKAGYDLEISAQISGSEGEDDAELEFTVIQIGDDWYVINYHEYYGEYEVSFSTPS